jgi:alcohol dehydrogenase
MRQLTLVKPRCLEWHDVPAPSLQGEREAIVRPIAVATCDLDRDLIHGATPFPLPIAVSHECVAVVSEIGAAVRTVAPGDFVSVPFQISCGTCEACRRGHTGNCTTVAPRSMYGFGSAGGAWGGALSESLRVPFADAMLVRVPRGVEPIAVASASDNMADGWRAVAPAIASGRSTVLVVGGGFPSIGLYAAGIAVSLGAARVDYLDRDPQRLATAERLGAAPIPGPAERLGPYAITVDASREHAGLACALRSTEPEGICTSVAIYFEPTTPIPLLEMYAQTITFRTGRAHARAAMPDLLELVSSGRFRPGPVTHSVAAWSDAADVLADLRGKTVMLTDPTGHG